MISNNAHNQKVLFKTVDKLLHRRPEKQYPAASSTIELANKFADFFSNKITAIRNELVTHPFYYTQSNQEEQYVQCAKLISFKDVTEHEIKYFIDKVDKKTCELDPVPAIIFQGCKKSLLPLQPNYAKRSYFKFQTHLEFS